MILFVEHDLLVSGPDFETCSRHVLSFFNKSKLVHYDSVEVDPHYSLRGVDPGFHDQLNEGVEKNREILAELLAKLKSEGCSALDDILNLPQGFQSKLLHTMSHVLDGFFGIDSRFFDIDEISHWISDSRKSQLKRQPDQCWLIRVKAQSVYGEGFEKKSGIL